VLDAFALAAVLGVPARRGHPRGEKRGLDPSLVSPSNQRPGCGSEGQKLETRQIPQHRPASLRISALMPGLLAFAPVPALAADGEYWEEGISSLGAVAAVD
jgi:hypothetical protein